MNFNKYEFILAIESHNKGSNALCTMRIKYY